MALALAAAFVVTVRPSDWTSVACDALGLNVVAGTIVGAAGLIVAGRFRAGWVARLTALGAAGLAAAIVFAAIEPTCLAGPFAKVDPAQGPLWLDHVVEARSLPHFGETKASLALAAGLSMILCLVAQAAVAWRTRSIDEGIRLLLLAALTALGFRYLKMIPYAQLVGLYCLARAPFVLPMPGRQLTPRAAAMLLILFATPVPLMVGLSAILPPDTKEEAEGGIRACASERDFGALAKLPPARILPQPDLGGYLALLGQHQTMIGNYHRLDREIMRAAAVFGAPLDQAKAHLDAWRIDIIAHCAGLRIYPRQSGEGSLARAIERGAGLPEFLVPIDLGIDSGVRAWRVMRP